MKWKYNVIFLFMLFSLALPEKLNAQYCLDFKYDKSGNRTEVYAHNCGFEYKELSREMGDEEISVEIESEGLLVYPNPNDGCFVVCLENDDIDSPAQSLHRMYVHRGHALVEFFVKAASLYLQFHLCPFLFQHGSTVYSYRALPTSGRSLSDSVLYR